MRYIELDVGAARLREGPEPALAPGFARVRVLACGVCGTDRDLLHGMVLPPGASYPVRPGHEVAGIVERVDGGAGHVREGDLAILHPLAPCGRCAECRHGEREQRCHAIRTLGIQDPGGFAEQVVWPATRMLPANGLDPAAAALLADAAATAHNAVRLAGVPRGGRLCVLGAGGLGDRRPGGRAGARSRCAPRRGRSQRGERRPPRGARGGGPPRARRRRT